MVKKRKNQERLLDFTQIETIYEANLNTIRLKIAPQFVASPDAQPYIAHGPAAVYEVLRVIFAALDDDQEHLVLLVLNQVYDITGYKLISSGGQDRAVIDAKVLFRNALLLGASSIILAHNHPSGRLDPSEEDLLITTKLVEAGRILDIEVLDHVIYTAKGYTSLKKVAPFVFSLKTQDEQY